MIHLPHRTTLTFVLLSLAYVASVLYDMLVVQDNAALQLLLAAGMAASLAGLLLLTRYPAGALKPLLFAAWPLHLYTAAFFWVCLAHHGGASLNQVVFYTLFGYATYVLVPLALLLDHRMLVAFAKLIAVTSAMLAIPSFWGALGHLDLFGIPLRVKFSYAEFSGIVASAGLFEHPEGHAFQMAMGAFCSWFVVRKRDAIPVYAACLCLNLMGLVVSQGRAVILGVAIALLFSLLPELFRRSRPIFLGTFAIALTFPFFILPQIARLPAVAGYLRTERGLSGREEAWQFAFSLIAERPWSGHGVMASAELTAAEQKNLRKSGFSGAGTTFHNTFISKAVDLGLIATSFYALLYLLPLYRICTPSQYAHEQELVRSILLLTLTAAIFRDYNVGGIRSTAMAGTIFLGLANLWEVAVPWGWNLVANAADAPRPADRLPNLNSTFDLPRMRSAR
jgi:O-antigen ligase